MFNIFFIVGLAVVFAILVAVLITRKSSPTKESFLLPEEDAKKDPKEVPALTMGDLEAVVKKFCQSSSLEMKERLENSERDIIWVAESRDPILFGTVVFGAVAPDEEAGPLTPLSKVLEFKDFVKGLGSSKGFLLSTGYFSRDVHQPLEGVKVTLLNRLAVLKELDRV